MTNYKEAHDVWRGWEKSCLAIARYYESVIDKMTDDERMSPSGRYSVQYIFVLHFSVKCFKTAISQFSY